MTICKNEEAAYNQVIEKILQGIHVTE